MCSIEANQNTACIDVALLAVLGSKYWQKEDIKDKENFLIQIF